MTDAEEFDAFWRAFPKKLAKGDARKAWAQTKAIRPDLETILAAITKACRSEQWMKDCGQWVPYPATWLRAERWDDDYSVSLTPKLPLNNIPQLPDKATPEQIAAARAALAQIKLRRVA